MTIENREPCIDCLTPSGAVVKGRDYPFRAKGRCRSCDRRHRTKGKALAGFRKHQEETVNAVGTRDVQVKTI